MAQDTHKTIPLQTAWEDSLSVCQQVENERDCRLLIGRLQQADVQFLTLQAVFAERYQLEEFEEEWRLQTGCIQAVQALRRRQARRNEDFPKEIMMQLGNQYLRGLVFMQVYRQQLRTMQHEYNVRFFATNNKLFVLTRPNSQLNVICRSQLSDMNYNLQIVLCQDPNLNIMLIASTKLRKKLESEGVYVWLHPQGGKSVIYSISISPTIMTAAIASVGHFDIIALNLCHHSLLFSEVTSVKGVIQAVLREDVSKLQQEYQVDVEWAQGNAYLVLHCKHKTFGEEPLQLLQEKLRDVLVFSVKSSQIKQFDNMMRKVLDGCEFVAGKINKRRNETFLAVHLKNARSIDKQKKEQFIKLFLLLLQPNMEIKFYFNHLQQNEIKTQSDKLRVIAQEFHLQIQNQSLNQGKSIKSKLKFRDFSEIVRIKKQTELSLFLQAIIFKQKVSLLKFSQNCSSPLNLIINLTNQKRSAVMWAIPTLILPKFVNFGGASQDFIKSTRNRPLQQAFHQQSGCSFKVWNLQLTSHKFRYDTTAICKPFMLRNAISTTNRSTFTGSFEIISLEECNIDELGVIAHLTSGNSGKYLPYCIFRRIS